MNKSRPELFSTLRRATRSLSTTAPRSRRCRCPHIYCSNKSAMRCSTALKISRRRILPRKGRKVKRLNKTRSTNLSKSSYVLSLTSCVPSTRRKSRFWRSSCRPSNSKKNYTLNSLKRWAVTKLSSKVCTRSRSNYSTIK